MHACSSSYAGVALPRPRPILLLPSGRPGCLHLDRQSTEVEKAASVAVGSSFPAAPVCCTAPACLCIDLALDRPQDFHLVGSPQDWPRQVADTGSARLFARFHLDLRTLYPKRGTSRTRTYVWRGANTVGVEGWDEYVRFKREAEQRRVAEGYRRSLVYEISMLESIGRVEQPKRKVDDLARCCTFPCKLHVVRAPIPHGRLLNMLRSSR
jgi:hypothetical protein